MRSPSCRSVVIVLAADVAVLDGIGFGSPLGNEGLVETVLQDRSDGPVARRTDADPTTACGFEASRTVGAYEREDAETGSEALLGVRLGAHDRLVQRDRGRADLLGSGQHARRRPEGVAAMLARPMLAYCSVAVCHPRWCPAL